jgi:eukaryotic-like serine/threonine-protein kinase
MSTASSSNVKKSALGPYELETEVGSDLIGSLWAARTQRGTEAGRPVTIRRVAKSRFGQAALDDIAEAAFWAMGLESRALVAVEDVVGDAHELGVVFRRLEGATLRALLRSAKRNGRPIPEAAVVRILIDAARQLMSLSLACEAVPRYAFAGVTADSVWVESTGATRVLDACVWAVAARTAVVRNGLASSILAPEQLDGQRDSRTDVYALGLLLWEMLAMRRPRRTASESSRGAFLPHLERLVRPAEPPVGRNLGDLVACALDPDPNQRFDTPFQLAVALTQITAPLTESEAALLLGLTRPSGVRPKGDLDGSLQPLETPLHDGPRKRLDTMPYHDAEDATPGRPLVSDLESEGDDSNRDTLPNFIE